MKELEELVGFPAETREMLESELKVVRKKAAG